MKNSAHLLGTLCVCLSLGLGTGCDELSSPAPAPAMKGPPPATTPPSAPTDSSEHHGESASESETVGNSGGVEREVAEVGVGKQGRNYGGGIVSEPIRAYFRTGQRLQLMQMKQALQQHKALHGALPKTHEAFMKDVIQANSIQLPELPAGERYVYDPDKGELMVERPAP